MNAKDFLNKAVEEQEERASYYNSPDGERSMDTATAIFNAWTGHNLSTADGWRFMIALKQAREVQGEKEDNYIDLAGYASLLGEEVCDPPQVNTTDIDLDNIPDDLEVALQQGFDMGDWSASQFHKDSCDITFHGNSLVSCDKCGKSWDIRFERIICPHTVKNISEK